MAGNNPTGIDQFQTGLDSRQSPRDQSEIFQAKFFLVLVEKWAVIGSNRMQVSG